MKILNKPGRKPTGIKHKKRINICVNEKTHAQLKTIAQNIAENSVSKAIEILADNFLSANSWHRLGE